MVHRIEPSATIEYHKKILNQFILFYKKSEED